MGVMHPKMAAVHRGVLALAAAIGQREKALSRCRGLKPHRARLVMMSAVEQEAAAFTELCVAMYDDGLLDLIKRCKKP